MFTKVSIFFQLDIKNSIFCSSFDSFWTLFAGSKSLFEVISASIIDKVKLIELMLFCHIIPQWRKFSS